MMNNILWSATKNVEEVEKMTNEKERLGRDDLIARVNMPRIKLYWVEYFQLLLDSDLTSEQVLASFLRFGMQEENLLMERMLERLEEVKSDINDTI